MTENNLYKFSELPLIVESIQIFKPFLIEERGVSKEVQEVSNDFFEDCICSIVDEDPITYNENGFTQFEDEYDVMVFNETLKIKVISYTPWVIYLFT